MSTAWGRGVWIKLTKTGVHSMGYGLIESEKWHLVVEMFIFL